MSDFSKWAQDYGLLPKLVSNKKLRATFDSESRRIIGRSQACLSVAEFARAVQVTELASYLSASELALTCGC